MITIGDYISIACALERADLLQSDAANSLVSMQNVLSSTRASDGKILALRNEIEQVRDKIALQRSQPLQNAVAAVQSLQRHVERYYGSVNSFLADNSVKVSPFFASLSLEAGYEIAAANIGSSCIS
jgi:hypothetical protein